MCGENRCEITGMVRISHVVRNTTIPCPTYVRGVYLHKSPTLHFSGVLHSLVNLWKLQHVLTNSVPTLAIFTQDWTTNSFVLSLLLLLNTLPCTSVSSELQHSFPTSSFLTAFNTSPFTCTLLKERQSIILRNEKRSIYREMSEK